MEFNLYLIRHGETEHNRGCIIQGQLDIPLSKVGIKQAKLLSKSLANLEGKEVWASDLKRSWQTANFIISCDGKDLSNEERLLGEPLPIINTDVRIRERHYGIAQGQSTAYLQKLAGNAGVKVCNYIPPEAESPIDVKNRAISFFQDLCNNLLLTKKTNCPVLLIGHGGWLREFVTYLASLTGISDFTTLEKDAVTRLTPNTAVSQFSIVLGNDGKVSDVKCISLHDKAHLDDPVVGNPPVSDELAV